MRYNTKQIFDELLVAKAIKLPCPKRPKEADKTDNPNYCWYYQSVIHSTERCSILKDIIEEMFEKKEI